MEYLQVKQVHSTPLIVDNTFAINLAKNPNFHDRTTHINTKYCLIQHHVEANTIHYTIAPLMNRLQTSSQKRLEEKSSKDSEQCLDSPKSLKIKGGNVDT